MIRFYIFISLLISFGIFLLGSNKFSKNIYLFLSFLFFLFVSSFRAMWVGADTPAYFLLYNNINSFYSVDYIKGHMETGFIYFCKLLSFINTSPQFLLIVTSFIVLFFVFRFIYKYSLFYLLSTLIYSCDIFLFNLTGMRQSLAMALIIYSFDYILKRKFMYFCLTIILATLFHKTAILFFPVYFLLNLEINLKKIIYVISISIIMTIFFQYSQRIIFYIFSNYVGYSNSIWFNEIKLASILKFIINFLIFTVSYCFYLKQKIYFPKKQIQFYNILLWLSLIAICISLLSIRASLFSRETLYFAFFNIILLPNIIMNNFNKNITKFFISAYTILFFVLYASICLYYRPEWFGVIPYTFFWEV